MDESIRARNLTALSLVAVLAAGCVNNGGQKDTEPPEEFIFEVTPILSGHDMTNVDVDVPDPAHRKEGMYKGGHVRVDMDDSQVDKNIIWRSKSPFTIMFTDLKDNNGKSGGKGEACSNHAADTPIAAAPAGPTPYELTCAVNRIKGKKTYTIKYYLTAEDSASRSKFTLDPIIIIDR